MVGMEAVRDVRVEGQHHVGLRRAYLAHELLAKLKALDKLGVGMAEKRDALDPEELGGDLLLPLAHARDLGPRRPGVASPFIARGRDDEIHDSAAPRHQEHGARAVELDVIWMRDDAQRPLD